jgi:hypothetical protein
LAQSHKEHLTAECCENASGSHKPKLEVAHKAKKTQMFKGMKANAS